MVRYCMLAMLVLAISAGICVAEQPKSGVPQYLQGISVTVKSGSSQGSGTLVTREIPGKGTVAFVWTAAHVVDNLRSVRKIVDSKGGVRYLVEFDDPSIVAERYQDGRKVGHQTLDCKVVKYSDYRYGTDLAILMVRLRDSYGADVCAKFPKANFIPPVGSDLSHCGSLLGQFGSNSYTTGTLSQTGRLLDGKVFDQVTAVAFPGSSGGGVYLAGDGTYVGMLTRGTRTQGFNFIVPVRLMHDWAKDANVEWAIDMDAEMPSWDDLMDLPVEDEGILPAMSSFGSYDDDMSIVPIIFDEMKKLPVVKQLLK